MTTAAYTGIATISAFALIGGLWLWINGDAKKTQTFLMLVAGCGIGGLFGSALVNVFGTTTGLVSSPIARVIGVSGAGIIAAICVVLTLEVVLKGIWKKTAKPKAFHPWLALALPTIALASGVPILAAVFGALAGALGEAGNTVAQLSTG